MSLLRVSERNDALYYPHISLTVQVCIWHLSAHSNVCIRMCTQNTNSLHSDVHFYRFQQTFESLSAHQKDSMIKTELKRCAKILERSTERRSIRQNNLYGTRSADPKIRKWPKKKIIYIIILLLSVCCCLQFSGHRSRIGRYIKLFVSTVIPFSHAFACQFGLEIFYR